ncbi:MAG TPA: shikimate dehydrogenase [Verrucomicrobiota bacterium]|nr:shikimate dehydrogenase [Verrucomicrobiota bacterium]HOA60949.1 shikimate dehydrogenase [Verrucomicrobiota bacterium]HOF48579.1 shikimate dehydrogenase [Verrucomicrobiota bacterium]HOG86904.1 shikimate dehydrogenase [Verrucomicrobiota bacterium]HOR71641.1 shikimate dehydrogenase [Verrucomicrobiota bacterium]
MSEARQPPINASTRLCAVYGHPIAHSASPPMQNAGFAALRLNWQYLAFDVRPEDLGAAISGARTMGFIGLNLTVPHKLLAMELVHCLDASARSWGAVNTIRFEAQDADGAWQPVGSFAEPPTPPVRAQGFNTDADAITRALREDLGFEPRGASVLVLGAGGAGRTAALKLAHDGVSRLFLVNRTMAKAEQARNEVLRHWPRVAVALGYPEAGVDLILNATSLGLRAGDALPLDTRQFPLRRARSVYDMIYRPAETPLLAAARASGCRVANGLGMLLHQGTRSLEIWTGRPAPVEAMRRALEQSLDRTDD